MQPYQNEFIELALEIKVLRFGDFTLKSGRKSPYFFNSGLFDTGYAAAKLGRAYAAAVADAGIECDMLFGPAYKGIPLVALAAAALAEHFGANLPFCFNRKEAKNHGEGGTIVGAPIKGRVLILDDVITAGTATREAIDIITAAGGSPAGIVIALDRQERGKHKLSAVQEIEQRYGIPVASIIKLDELIEHLETSEAYGSHLANVRTYRKQWATENIGS
ncbi:MAG: orotate phosphoribosyltransferase [Gammaproteobacteria bacterium]|jgi:orotate phosphoribosyltransferase|nr:orotate phosphoribosyltransferase [Gammaproteobacteria bacterium]MDP7297256.1 orotate phosphoribosyltransferase [Gammaproteobacteria bacterium]MDP7419768.1 orotate phosphoribosyltransferase [Gammaproteobacteria bacterium]HJP38085.1 orotate phosphoribosyltransferase [Gammaproteobacteria bacterium]